MHCLHIMKSYAEEINLVEFVFKPIYIWFDNDIFHSHLILGHTKFTAYQFIICVNSNFLQCIVIVAELASSCNFVQFVLITTGFHFMCFLLGCLTQGTTK